MKFRTSTSPASSSIEKFNRDFQLSLNPLDAPENWHFHQLDATRALAALVVAVAHTLEIFWSPILGTTGFFAEAVATVSQHAVLVFFLISGYLITQSIRRNATTHGTFRLSAYACDRLFRIYPPLVVALIICALIDNVLRLGALPGSTNNPLPLFGEGLVMDRTLTAPLSQWISAVLLLRTQFNLNVPLWSLFLEVRIYVVAGFVAVGLGAFKGKKHLFGLASITIALLLVGLTCYSYGPRLLAYAPAWVLGATLSILKVGSRPARLLLKVGAWSACTVIFITLVVTPAALSVLHGGTNFHDLASGIPTLQHEGAGTGILANSITMVAFGFLYAIAVLDWSWTNPFSRKLAQIAPWSYTLYLLNWPLLCVALILSQSWMGNDPVRIGLTSMMALGLQVVLARKIGMWIERPAEIRNHVERFAPLLLRQASLRLRSI